MSGSAQAYRACGWWPGERLEHRYEQHVLARPTALAIADSAGGRLTHAQLWERAGVAAEYLARAGVAPGDIVLLFLPNRVEWQIGLLAVLRLQAVPASLPTKTDIRTLAYSAELVGCRAVLTSVSRRGGELAEAAASAAGRIDGQPDVIQIAVDGSCERIRNGTPGGSLPGPARALDHIMFTSSTTGMPKAVMHSVDTLAALNSQFSERFSLGPDTPIFMSSPLGHSVGGIHGARLALHTGAPLVLQEIWEPSAARQMIDEYHCDFTAAATPFLKDLLDASDSTSGELALSTFLCGGAPVPPALLEKAWARFPNTFVTNLWGMTEGGLVTCVPETPKVKLIETAGIGLPGLELQILGEDGSVLDAGHEGELAMRGPGVFVGYYGQDDLYQSLLTPDEFFRTGDLARVDEEGYVRITGRLKDLIIRGGVNISPLPAEDVLATHPMLRSVAVVGFPDERLGERICAVVEPTDEKPTLDELIRYATDGGLPKRQLPEVVRYVDAMPRTAAGKIRKPVLQDLIRSAAPGQLDLATKNAD